MDQRHILHSNCASPQLPLDDSRSFLRPREPLSEAAGNSQLLAVSYDDSKESISRVDTPAYSIPAIPLQPPIQIPQQRSDSTPLNLRRQSIKKHRNRIYTGKRNPIYDSPQYQSYRSRQSREGSTENCQVWPTILEDAFLDALIDIPRMGRKKFTLNLRPYGRNELITEYLWIAYKHSLPPGAIPDRSFRRERKQVSSHIQVLKGFLRDHPAFDRLFPDPKKKPKNEFDESFKHDPCLLALMQGRLPAHRYARYEATRDIQVSMRPARLWLHITDSSEEVGTISHTYTRLAGERARKSLDSIPNWHQRFPYLERLCLQNQLNCDVIHMDATLELMQGHVPNGSFLTAKTEISIPGRQLEGCSWKTTTRLIKPSELYGDETKDPPEKVYENSANVLSVNDMETRIKLPYPPHSWAYTFTSLTELQAKYDGRRRNPPYDDDVDTLSARDYLEQISMYQEIESCSGRDSPWVRRGILVWTFHKAKHGQPGSTIWGYLDPSPPRIACMSPSPQAGQRYMATMNENFHSFLDTPIELQEHLIDPFNSDILPPTGASSGLQSPYEGPNYSFQQPQYTAENLSFASQSTLNSQSTFVDNEAVMQNFMPNGNGNLAEYEHNTAAWSLQNNATFHPNWLTYNLVPSNAPQSSWEPDSGNQWPEESESRSGTWTEESNAKIDWDNVNNLNNNDWNGNDNDEGLDMQQGEWREEVSHEDLQPKNGEHQWAHIPVNGEHNWEVIHHPGNEVANWSATGTAEEEQEQQERRAEDSSWIDAETELKEDYVETAHHRPSILITDRLPEVSEAAPEKWNSNDGEIDYQKLADQLKQE